MHQILKEEWQSALFELDKKVQFYFIKLFRGVATKLEFYLPKKVYIEGIPSTKIPIAKV